MVNRYVREQERQIELMKKTVEDGNLFKPFEVVAYVDDESKEIKSLSQVQQISLCVQKLKDKDTGSLRALSNIQRLAESLGFWLKESTNHYNALLGMCCELLDKKLTFQQPRYKTIREVLLENKCSHCTDCGIKFKENEEYYRTPCEHAFHRKECFEELNVIQSQTPNVLINCLHQHCSERFYKHQITLCTKKFVPLYSTYHENETAMNTKSRELKTKGDHLKTSILELLKCYEQFLRAAALKEEELTQRNHEKEEKQELQKKSSVSWWSSLWRIVAAGCIVCAIVLLFLVPPVWLLVPGAGLVVSAVLGTCCKESDAVTVSTAATSSETVDIVKLSNQANEEKKQAYELSKNLDQLQNEIQLLIDWTARIQPSVPQMEQMKTQLEKYSYQQQ